MDERDGHRIKQNCIISYAYNLHSELLFYIMKQAFTCGYAEHCNHNTNGRIHGDKQIFPSSTISENN